MRILWITHPESDYLASTLYRGMCQVLGVDNVIDYPWKDSYHGQTSYYEQPYGRGPGCTSPCAWQKPSESVRRTEVEIKNDNFDCVILESTRPYAIHALDAVIASGWTPLPPVFVCCGEDYSETNILLDVGNKFGAKALFKRELLKGVNIQHVYPCPFASVIPEDWPLYVSLSKHHDAFCVVGNTDPTRQAYIDALQRISGYNIYSGSDKQGVRLDQFQYWEKLSRSRIGVNLKGFGWDTLRFLEIPAVMTMLLTQRIDIQYPHEFTDGVNCAIFNDANEMDWKLRHYLDHPDECQRIARAGYDHVLAHHTSRRRAEYVLDIVGRYI